MPKLTTLAFGRAHRAKATAALGMLVLLAPAGLRAQNAVQPVATFGTAGLASTSLDGSTTLMSSTTPAQFFVSRMGQVVQAGSRLLVCGKSGTSFVVKGFQLNGQPDPTFGTNGVLAVAGLNAESRTLAVQPNGQIVAAGARHGFVVDAPIFVRFSPAGVLDATFGTGGVFSIDPESGTFPDTGIDQVVVLSNGNLLAAGARADGAGNARLMCLLPTGQLNTAYNNGQAYASLVDVQLHQLRALPNGKVLGAGAGPLLNGNTKRPAAAIMLTPTGQPDASFGTAGLALINGTQTTSGVTSPAFTEAFAASVQPTDGKIVLAGRVHYDATVSAGNLPVLLRLNPDGTPDAAFNTAANRLLTDTGGFQDVAAQPNGTLVASGNYSPSGGPVFQVLLARYTAAGQLDATFNPARPAGPGFVPAGAYTQSLASNAATASQLLTDPTGSILTLGGFETRTGQSQATGLLLARYNASSTLDTRAGAETLGLQASPVPARDAVQLRYLLPASASVRVLLCDPLGRLVGSPAAVSQGAGPQSLPLDLRGLAAGLYFCTLETGAWHQTVRLEVIP